MPSVAQLDGPALGVVNQSQWYNTARSGGAYGLGLIPRPGEITRSLSGLGNVPSDFQLARTRGYLPVHHGWIVGPKYTFTSGSLTGLGEEVIEEEGPTQAEKNALAIQELTREVRRYRRMHSLGLTISVAAGVALLAVKLFRG